ncbi:MAG TPA: hypothetical protein VFK05_29930 [Polyangiaceae bacterium]|nr:hypothetical protein [Polyangiaceae bacterium]
MSLPDDPERLAETTPRSQLGELFASASRDLPSDEQLARLAAQLAPILGGPAGPPAPVRAPAAPSGTSLRVVLGVTASAVVLLVGAGLALHRPTQPTAVEPTSPPKVVDALPGDASARAALPSASAIIPPPPVAPTPSTETGSSQSPGQPGAASSNSSPAHAKAPSEAALLERARRALDTAPGYALQLANQHRALFPHGSLSQEREVIAIEALRRLHRASEADQRATGFSQTFPGSAHQRMVDEAAPK